MFNQIVLSNAGSVEQHIELHTIAGTRNYSPKESRQVDSQGRAEVKAQPRIVSAHRRFIVVGRGQVNVPFSARQSGVGVLAHWLQQRIELKRRIMDQVKGDTNFVI